MWVQVPGWCERPRKLIQAEAEALAGVVSFRDFDARAIIDVPSVHDDVLANCGRGFNFGPFANQDRSAGDQL